MNIEQSVAAFLNHRRARGLAPDSLKQYERHLKDWQYWRQRHDLPDTLESIRLDDLDSFCTYLATTHVPHARNPRRPAAPGAGVAPATLAAYRRTLKAWWCFCARRRWLRDDQHDFFDADGVPIPQLPDEARDACDEPTLQKLVAACGDDGEEEAARNRAILWLLFESGMRVSELCGLNDAQLEHRERRALIISKGRRREYVFWHARTAAALLHYLRVRSGERGDQQPVFRGLNSRNRGRLTPDGVRSMIRRIAAAAGVALPAGSPVHWIRRGFIQHCLDAGLDLVEVQQLARHKDVKTTMIYAKRKTDRLQRAHERAFGSGKSHQ